MPSVPLPDPGPDSEEPDGFVLLPGSGEADPGEFGPEQGLFITLPAEQLTLAGFAQNGESDTMTPGGLLSAVVDTVAGDDGSGLALCSDDQLAGIISAARRLESRAAWTLMAAMAEFARRRPGAGLGGPDPGGSGGPGPGGTSSAAGTQAEFAADELAFQLHLTPVSAASHIRQATAVSSRLPATFAALHAGRVHPVHVWIIEDETSILTPEDAAKADEVLAQLAPGDDVRPAAVCRA